jgi:AraC family transcriptional regulator, positive regulator of tynA and feaB
MVRSFSTDLVPISDRLDAWLCNAKEICGDCRFEFPKRLPFHGSIEHRILAGLQLTRFSSTSVSFAKFPVVSSTSPDRTCVLITQLEGRQRYYQHRTIALLKPGDTTLIDSGRPWRSDCADRCTRLYLRLPRWLVQDRLGSISLPLLPQISGASGLGATLFRFAASLYEEAEAMSASEGTAAIEAYLDMLAGCVRPVRANSESNPHCAQLRAQVELFIETHLPEPTLTPTEIARSVGMSVRHLHRLFTTKGCTVGEWIRERRLECCRNDLRDNRLSERSITDIAFFWGFCDSAHFSRCFKKSFGVSPREFRSNSSRDLWNRPPDELVRTLLSPQRQTRPN